MQFLKCNLDIGQESYGLHNMGTSHGTGNSWAAGNSRNLGIPEAQSFPSCFPGKGISREFPTHSFPLNIPEANASSSRWSTPQGQCKVANMCPACNAASAAAMQRSYVRSGAWRHNQTKIVNCTFGSCISDTFNATGSGHENTSAVTFDLPGLYKISRSSS